MRHPYEKFIRGELVAIGLAVFFGLIALIQGVFLLIILGLFLVAASLICDGLIALYMQNQIHGVKQLLRSILLILFVTILLILL
ncbi:hypothetical protein [Ornithinibacillus bavariensis]|uniref:Uncharacterized protein n=1 Tax=Ornithinibacillus bavariensis TaxID=545502 RepID=A0A919X956_9BACI|nr:hypothetical protein [Ornithinibacillus bavariensis]GIO26805.1 hypothetical protein J43TS3_14160 [Ornithinibacillus bavariensis]HAM80747.1 hypothetical protein [Ornithinibacillus sp.]